MLQRADAADRIAAVGVVLGAIALFLPWYSYAAPGAHVTVNGFRASLLGELLFCALAAMALLLLLKTGIVDERTPSAQQERRLSVIVACVAGGAVLLQLIADIAAHGRGIGAGLLLALVSAIVLGVAAWLRGREYTPRLSRISHAGEDLFD